MGWRSRIALARRSRTWSSSSTIPTAFRSGILITEAARAEGGHLINKDGYRYLQDYDLGKPEPKPVLRSMELGPRDRLSQAFMQEVAKGRTIDTEYGPVVNLDLRHLGKKIITTKLPLVRELCLK